MRTSLIQASVLKFLSDPQPQIFCVLQGLFLGPLFFKMYTTSLSSLIAKFQNIKHHLYVDVTQISVAITPDNVSSAISEHQKCLLSAMSEWLLVN